jgi:hypothetical protein
MPSAFKGSNAFGVQGFKCLRRSRVQMLRVQWFEEFEMFEGLQWIK